MSRIIQATLWRSPVQLEGSRKRCLAMGVSRWVVSRPCPAPRSSGNRGLGPVGCPALRLEPSSARWRRRMGSVGGWPLAIPTTVASGGNRDGGPPQRGRLPNRSSTRGESGSHPSAAAAGACARSPLGNLEGESRSPQGSPAGPGRRRTPGALISSD